MSETKDERGRAVRQVRPFLEELEAKPFWANLREHRLTAQRCKACGKFFSFPPQGSCPHCLSPEYEWVTLSGKGRVYSFVTYHRAWHPAYQEKTPYNVSLVDLDEGPRLISNVMGCKYDEVTIGMPVEIVYDDREEYTLPQFRPQK
ncbi:MAG: Zn-ribbon domain-containing OB-fold protein [Candidatus Binatia bacterium]